MIDTAVPPLAKYHPLGVVLAFLAIPALAVPPGMAWPFVTIRQADVTTNPEKAQQVIAVNARYPGSADEYWLGGGLHLSRNEEDLARRAAILATLRPGLDRAGIAFGMQQGITLGHSPGLYSGDRPPAWYGSFTEDDYACGRDGQRVRYFCPRAPRVLEAEAGLIERTARRLKPVSVWLDDDLRMAGWKDDTCFCPRCLAAFNARFGHSLTREKLVGRLSDGKRSVDSVRRDWRIFAGESLAVFAAAARRGADRVDPKLRLALQTVNGGFLDAALDYAECLRALAGTNGLKSAVRTGGGNYWESVGELQDKLLDCAHEAERCHALPFVTQVSYEQENYTREVLHKSAEMILLESALALAAGCDALTEYWWDPARDEPLAYYEEFCRMLVAWRPYLERVGSFSRTTSLGGLARFRGAAYAALRKSSTSDRMDGALARLGLPVSVAEARCITWYVNGQSLDEWGVGDAERLATDGAVVDLPSWHRLMALGGEPVAAAAAAGRIVAFDLSRAVSGFLRQSSSVATHAERAQLLDRIDRVRLLPVRSARAHPLLIYPRVDANVRTVAVTVMNGSMGRCLPAEFRIRRPVSKSVRWFRPEAEPVTLTVRPGDGDEIVVTLPTLPGMQLGTLVLD